MGHKGLLFSKVWLVLVSLDQASSLHGGLSGRAIAGFFAAYFLSVRSIFVDSMLFVVVLS